MTNLYNQNNFYQALAKDMLNAEKEVIIYSPFIGKYRAEQLLKTFKELIRRNIAVFVFTRTVEEHEIQVQEEIQAIINEYRAAGVFVSCLSDSIHEKAAIIDQKISWEGSLNILSQRNSREIMRRFEDKEMATQLICHLNIGSKLRASHRVQRPGSPISKVEKIAVDVVFPVINWWFTALFKVMIFMLKSVLMIFNIVSVILGN
jgi:phosphatidylserine/phosphatidylglycerophosphate/cardiolipin synthase-like enzyme